MSASTSTSIEGVVARRLLLIHSTTVYQPPSTADAPPPSPSSTYNTFDANVIMVLSVLLCALICSLGLNSIIRCTMRCSAVMSPTRAGPTTGLKRKALKSFTTVSYTAELNLPGLDTECVICLSDFAAGERVRLLPKCHHAFHVRCIDKWLTSHSSCPTCRDCLIDTCHKIVGATSEIPAPLHVVNILEPLEPEGIIRNYRGIS